MSDDLKVRLLVVDDEQSIRKLCMTIGNTLGYSCTEAESAEAALAKLDADAPDLILTDLKLPTLSGVELLKQARMILPRAEVAIMTGHGSIESAVDAMKLGAYDYIEKPFRVEKMRLLLQRMAEKVRLVTENEFLRERVSTEDNLDGIIGTSANIQDVLRMVSRLKDTRTPVLISGESGTGKELVARAIHFRGALAQTPFVAVDCGSLVPTLMESELFGYEKGAFTGAIKTKAGLFQAANGGTIFLDEIGELPLEMQAKLLRVLQEKEVRPVGSNEKVTRGRTRDRGDEPRPRSGLSRGNISQGPLFPAECGDRTPAGIARPPFGHPHARPSFPGPLCAGIAPASDDRSDE